VSAEFSEVDWTGKPPTPEEMRTATTAARCLRDAAELIEDTATETDTTPWESPAIRSAMVAWVSLMDPCHAKLLVEWLQAEADEAEQIGPDQFAVKFAQSILGELAEE
jgi:light-regulated signal transduction histidine kinase (bacteriophytochrome)